MLGNFAVRIVISAFQPRQSPTILDVLCFHRVLAAPDPFRRDCPTSTQFRQLLTFYKKFSTILSLEDGLNAVLSERRPGLFTAVTFDDGYKDNIDVALPILSEAGIRPTIFIASRFLNGPMMFNDIVDESIRTTNLNEICIDDLLDSPLSLKTIELRIIAAELLNRKIKYLPPVERDRYAEKIAVVSGFNTRTALTLTESELQRADTQAFDLGGHSHNHLIATTVSEAAFKEDIGKNKLYLENLVQKSLHCFAYPNGTPGRDFLPVHEKIVRDIGYRYGFSAEKELILPRSNRFALPRFTPWGHNNVAALRQIIGALKGVSCSTELSKRRAIETT